MTLAILCSGQGHQHAGMFDLTADIPRAASIFADAAGLLGHDPRAWVRDATEDALRQNRNAQILCTVQALSASVALSDAWPRRRCVAGYSVGEVAAWSVAGLIAASDTLALADSRARAMDAARTGGQGMLFVRGLSRESMRRLCTDRQAAIAIINPGDAWVVGGEDAALRAIAAEAVQAGATRMVPVGVEVASHTYLLHDASTVFATRLADISVASRPGAGTRLFSGIDGAAVLDVHEGIRKLALQISHAIDWAACLEGCVEAGAGAFLELGPGRALAEMAAAAYPGIPARSLDDFKSLQGAREWLARHADQ